MGWTEGETAASIPQRFEEQVRARPNHPAISELNRKLTYAELGRLVDRYAAALGDRSGLRSRSAALLLGHNATAVAAALAALKCGTAVVALNAGDPAARLAQLRQAVKPDLLLTNRAHLTRARAAGFGEAQMLMLEEIPVRQPGQDGGPPGDPDEIAFLICTSGSTGEPKVVMQPHRNVLHNVLRYTNRLDIGPDDRLAWLAALGGGQGLATALTALLNGATLCPFPITRRGVTGLGDWLEDRKVTVFDSIPSVLRSFARTLGQRRIRGVRLVRLASEAGLRSDFDVFRRHFHEDCELASVLASSEAGIIAQAVLHGEDKPPEGRLTVGPPAEGIEVLLLDEAGRSAPPGEVGEMTIRSRYLSPGYWNDAGLTAERFTGLEGVRSFRSGDLLRRSAHGELTVVGRADSQVKIRGHRLQLEEVETALARHPDVAAAAVGVRTNERGDAKLTAYVNPKPGRTPTAGDLRRALRETLPAHAVPSAFVFVEELPITAHGKVDRAQLDELEPPIDSAEASRAAMSETEEIVAGLWAEAFDSDEVKIDESFLELGGDSLIAAVIAAGVHEAFGVVLDLRAFASDPTVQTLAERIDERRGRDVQEEPPPLRRGGRAGPLSSTQLRMWSKGQADTRWHVAVPFMIRGPLDVEALRRSIEEIVRRHEILRTIYSSGDDHPIAVVRPPARFELPFDDLRSEADPPARAAEILDSDMIQPFDLVEGPLLRLRLLRLGDEEYELHRVTHHIIHDALSWKVFFDELAIVYPAFRQGRPSPLPGEPDLQYLDFALWEGEHLRPESPAYQAEVAWWQRTLQPEPPLLKLPFARSVPERGPADGARSAPEPGPSDGVGVLRWGIPPEHSSILDALGQAEGATYYMTRLAPFAALLAMEGGVDDLLVGTPVSTRRRPELQTMFGPFLNFAVLRLRFSEDWSFRAMVAEVRRAVIEIDPYVNIPREQLAPELAGRGVKIPRVAATFHSWSGPPPTSFDGIELEPLPRRCGTTPVFRLGVNRYRETNRCWVEFDPLRHDADRLGDFVGRLTALIAAVCAEPDRPLRELRGAESIAA